MWINRTEDQIPQTEPTATEVVKYYTDENGKFYGTKDEWKSRVTQIGKMKYEGGELRITLKIFPAAEHEIKNMKPVKEWTP